LSWRGENPATRKSNVSSKTESAMSYRSHIMTWAAIAWIAVWLTPYLYAVNDLITWR